jgi:predicted O-methyltransferase YrrM
VRGFLERTRSPAGVASTLVQAAQHSAERLARLLQSLATSTAIGRLGGTNFDRIPTWTSREELECLYDLATRLPPRAVALEIGSYLGASSCYLAAGLATVRGRLICVDTWQNETMPEGSRDTLEEFRRNVGALLRFVTILRKHGDELSVAELGGPVDLVFIDADHSYHAVRRDFAFADAALTDDGIVAMHDCTAYEGVARVLGEALASGRWVVAGHRDNLIWLRRSAWSSSSA